MRQVLIWRKSAYLGKWRISHLRYSLYRIDSRIRTALFVYYFRKKNSDLKCFQIKKKRNVANNENGHS